MRKKNFLFYPALFFCLLPVYVQAGSATLHWGANTENDLNGYNIYYGTATRSYGSAVPAGKTTEYTITGLEDGKKYYFAVTAVDTSGNESGYSAEVQKVITADTTPSEPPSTDGDLKISGLNVASSRKYEIVENGLVANVLCYTDRSYKYPAVPDFLKNATYIRTANDDMGRKGITDFLSFDISAPATVYVALDNRTSSPLLWMSGFSDTGSDVKTYSDMSLYAKEFPAGKVMLGSNNGAGSMYTVMILSREDKDVTPTPEEPETVPASDLKVSGLNIVSSRKYEVVENGFTAGATCYTDRSYTYPAVPDFLKNATYIRTANDDMGRKGITDFLSFDISAPATVYVALDNRTSSPLSWMSGFSDTGSDVKTYSGMSLYAKDFPAGKVTLGSNNGAGSMYTVVVVGKQ